MERLTERERNNDGSGISTKSLVVENGMKKGFPSSHCGRIVTKLAEYEDLEEQGKLLKLPCKVGDEVFIPIDFQEKIHHGIIVGVEYSKIRKCFVAVVRTDDDFLCYEKFEDFGKNVFLNRNRAEEALMKMIERNRYKHE